MVTCAHCAKPIGLEPVSGGGAARRYVTVRRWNGAAADYHVRCFDACWQPESLQALEQLGEAVPPRDPEPGGSIRA